MKILLLTEYIAPKKAVASIRWTKIIKYLKQLDKDIQIDVITTQRFQNRIPEYQIDEFLIRDLSHIDHYYQVQLIDYIVLLYQKVKVGFKKITTGNNHRVFQKNSQESFNLLNKMTNKTTEWNKTVNSCYKNDSIHLRKLKNWYLKVWSELVSSQIIYHYCIKRVDFNKYDFLITSYGPEWPHRVGSMIKMRHQSLLWIADFRDQWAREIDEDWLYCRNKCLTEKICIHADLLLKVNDHLILHESKNQSVMTLTNGFDPDEKQKPSRADQFSIVYTGTIYYTDDLNPLFAAIKELIQDGKIDLKDLVFSYCGNSSTVFDAYIREYNFDDCYINHGNLSRKESLKLQSSSSLLIMAGWSTNKEVIEWSGKMYEYMMSEKPILYLMTGDLESSVPSQKMKDLGGFCFETAKYEKEYTKMKDYILDIYFQWKNGAIKVENQDKMYINTFSYPEIARRFYQILKNFNYS